MLSRQKSSYFINPDSLESARLLRQDRLVTKNIQTLFPPSISPETIHTVLDIGCGLGGWVLDVGQRFPTLEITGIDIEASFITAAKGYARAESITNAIFLQADARQPLLFADATFDFIQIRFAQAFLDPPSWKSLLLECLRILSPGGTICITEYEFSVSTSSADEELSDLFTKALHKAQRTFSATGRSYGLAPALRQLLPTLGFVSLIPYAYVLDIAARTEDFQGWVEDFLLLNRSLRPFLLAHGVSGEDYDQLLQQALRDMEQEDYCASVFLISWTAKKPIGEEKIDHNHSILQKEQHDE